MEDPRHNDELILEKIKGLELLLATKFQTIEKHIEKSDKNFEDYHRRINVVELWQANSTGKLAIVSIAVGAGIMILVAWVNKHF